MRGLILLGLALASALQFDVKLRQPFCINEDVHLNERVTGTYSISPQTPGSKLEVIVTDSKRSQVYSQLDDTGEFTLVGAQDADYRICFTDTNDAGGAPESRSITLVLTPTAGITNNDQLPPGATDVLGMQLERVAGEASQVLDDILYLQRREFRMRDTSESTNERTQWLSLLSVGTVVAVAIWQLVYLRSYFKSKKLL